MSIVDQFKEWLNPNIAMDDIMRCVEYMKLYHKKPSVSVFMNQAAYAAIEDRNVYSW